uniref:Large ribosomal subunit protein uL23m n=1 Tax=Meleagris gallopavo TaxID=9103 RepID=G3UPC9_MELGA
VRRSVVAALPGRLGGPQLRIFRPNFFMLAVRPGVPQPEDTVQFRVSMEMTKVDIRNYLEKIYNVPVAAVRTRIQYGKPVGVSLTSEGPASRVYLTCREEVLWFDKGQIV